MIELHIPGRGIHHIDHLALDFNGTLAVDGILIQSAADQLQELAACLEIHVITSDTHGSARTQLAGLPIRLTILNGDHHTDEKSKFIKELGADSVIAIGNGSNDAAMLQAAVIGIVVIQHEGAAAEAIQKADLVFTQITHALEAIQKPERLIASLRK